MSFRSTPSRRGKRRAAALAGAAVLAAVPAVAAAQPPAIDEVMDRAAARVANVIEDLATVVMEEDYSQVYFSGQPRSGPARSRLRSDFLQVRLAGSDELTGFRDVIEYNGQRVRDRENRLAELFLGSHETAMDQLRRISEENARYNVGSTHRTFNVPTFGLFGLHPTNAGRFDFEKDGEGCAGVDAAWEVRFEEVVSPTITRGYNGIDLPARGRACVDPGTGDVYETEIELRHPAVGRSAGDRGAGAGDVRPRSGHGAVGAGRDARALRGARRGADERHRALLGLPALRGRRGRGLDRGGRAAVEPGRPHRGAGRGAAHAHGHGSWSADRVPPWRVERRHARTAERGPR